MKEKYMRRAIALAEKGRGKVAPNPMVGAVIVKDGVIIGEGCHERFGGLHAERNALKEVRESHGESAEKLLRDAELYVTLEPCCHYGKTPPCTDAIVEAGIGRVVIGSADPNPLVCGKGVSILRQAGIAVEESVLRKECDRLNPAFFHFITKGTPYMALKYAMTADGKIAAASGLSKWITGDTARMDVQRLRGSYTAIMVGIGTVLADDPLLTCRIPGQRQPIRIICDSWLRLPPDSQLCSTAGEVSTIAAGLSPECWYSSQNGMTEKEYWRRRERLESMGIKVLEIAPEPLCEPSKREPPEWYGDGKEEKQEQEQGHGKGKEQEKEQEKEQDKGKEQREYRIDVRQLAKQLGEMKIDNILVEGGASLNFSLLQAGLVNKVYAYLAPKLMGGEAAKTPVGGSGVNCPDTAYLLTKPKIQWFGDDLLLEYEVINRKDIR